jgi:hypothetical protein
VRAENEPVTTVQSDSHIVAELRHFRQRFAATVLPAGPVVGQVSSLIHPGRLET